VYDLWDEVFRIQLVQPGGAIQTVAVNVEGVLRNCCEAKNLSLVDRTLLVKTASYFVATLVEVNPVSQAMLDQIQLWVTRPNGSNAIGPGDSLLAPSSACSSRASPTRTGSSPSGPRPSSRRTRRRKNGTPAVRMERTP
jgi:hypothetical protein